MTETEQTPQPTAPPDRRPLEPMDPQLTDIQPGGGLVIRLERAWGVIRRWYLKRFRSAYVARMRERRRGDRNPCPHEVLDPRDLKFHRNQEGWHWAEEHDPFAWRDRLPFARDGLAELILFSLSTFGPAALLAWLTVALPPPRWAAAATAAAAGTLAVLGGLVVWFFRNPRRDVPQGNGLVVAPADGKVVEVEELDHEEFIGGPAVRIGIFLSIFNVHVNRVPRAVRVVGLRYRPGKCLNALRPESARENEQLALRLEENRPPYRPMIVTQITGALARRIVCRAKPGDELRAGAPFGMIKLGSRTELLLPRNESLQLKVTVGATVKAGASVLAEYV